MFVDMFTLVYPSTGEAAASVVVRARVLARTQGTPMLKGGVRCVGSLPESDEETDWPGFT